MISTPLKVQETENTVYKTVTKKWEGAEMAGKLTRRGRTWRPPASEVFMTEMGLKTLKARRRRCKQDWEEVSDNGTRGNDNDNLFMRC